jgi:hypothetical protein
MNDGILLVQHFNGMMETYRIEIEHMGQLIDQKNINIEEMKQELQDHNQFIYEEQLEQQLKDEALGPSGRRRQALQRDQRAAVRRRWLLNRELAAKARERRSMMWDLEQRVVRRDGLRVLNHLHLQFMQELEEGEMEDAAQGLSLEEVEEATEGQDAATVRYAYFLSVKLSLHPKPP